MLNWNNRYILFVTAFIGTSALFSCNNSGNDITIETTVEEVAEEPQDEIVSELALGKDGYYTALDGKFKAMFPGLPVHNSEEVASEVGPLGLATYVYEEGNAKAYMVSYTDYPPVVIENSEVGDLINGGVEGALSSLGIKQAEKLEDISIQGYPGKWFKGNDGKTFFVEYKMILAKNRLYQIGILQQGSYPSELVDVQFMDSFIMTD